MKRILAVLAAVVLLVGCASTKPTSSYPVPKMLDPVTEEVPNVHIR